MDNEKAAAGPIANEARSLIALDSQEFRAIITRINRGLSQIVALTLLGIGLGALLVILRVDEITTSTRVTFSFDGFDRGEYPDHSKFEADDLRSPAIVAEALRRAGLDASPGFQSKIRSALTIEGIIPPNVTKERDRLRASGQNVPVYMPDEYLVTLSLPRRQHPTEKERVRLLHEIGGAYSDSFRKTYGAPPTNFGGIFKILSQADYPEYELLLDTEMDSMRAYLGEQIDSAKSFRSRNTNLSFSDLLEQTNLFAQTQLSEVLGLIHEKGLSRNRAIALTKMNYHLHILQEQEQLTIEEDRVAKDLLTQTEQRNQNYVLAIKSQATQTPVEPSMVDQNLIDKLLKADAYNFLIRRSLESGLKVKKVQAEKARQLYLYENMKSFSNKSGEESTETIREVSKALKDLESSYNTLITNIRNTQSDFLQQQFGDAVRFSDEVRTAGIFKPLLLSTALLGTVGMLLGTSLSLLGYYITKETH